MKNIKVIIKKNIKIYDFLIKTRQTLRVIYNTKTRFYGKNLLFILLIINLTRS